jgi:uncharacterized protein
MNILFSVLCGLLFGIGLIVSGMADPAKVQNFLDVFGQFDGSLAFVMGGAVIVAFVGYRFAFARGRPLFDTMFHLPLSEIVDTRLVGGAVLFGAGWGLSGYCPGPAITALPLAANGTLVFVAAMLAGMFGARLFDRSRLAGNGAVTMSEESA